MEVDYNITLIQLRDNIKCDLNGEVIKFWINYKEGVSKMDTIIEKIKAIIKENYNIEIEEDEELREKGIDSLRTVQLIVIIEQQFNISFPVESMNGTDLKNVKTISRCIYDIIKKEERI